MRISDGMPVAVLELDVVAGIGLVDRQDLEHRPVVFLEEARDPLGRPVGRRRADRVLARAARVERRGRVQVGHRVAPHEFGHLDDPALVGLGQAEDLLRGDEVLDRRRRSRGRRRRASSGVPWSRADRRQDAADHGAPARRRRRGGSARRGRSSPTAAGRSRPSRARRGSPRPPPRASTSSAESPASSSRSSFLANFSRADPPRLGRPGQDLVLEERRGSPPAPDDRLRLRGPALPAPWGAPASV